MCSEHKTVLIHLTEESAVQENLQTLFTYVESLWKMSGKAFLVKERLFK